MTLGTSQRRRRTHDKDAKAIDTINELLDKRHAEQLRYEQSCIDTIDKTLELHSREFKRIQERYIAPFLEQYSFLLQGSSSILELLGFSTREIYHSKMLAHLWSQDNPDGPRLLDSFLLIAGIGELSVQQRMYSIYTEHCTGYTNSRPILNGRRIDLLIVNHSERWVVVIENKVYSLVHTWEDGATTQLSGYQEYCKHNKEFRGYKKHYILLSLNNQNKQNIAPISDWLYVDYYQLFKSIFPHRGSPEAQQYLATLWSLLIGVGTTTDNYDNRPLTTSQNLYQNIISKFI